VAKGGKRKTTWGRVSHKSPAFGFHARGLPSYKPPHHFS